MQGIATLLADEEQTLVGPIPFAGMPTDRAGLRGIVCINLDRQTLMQEGFIGEVARARWRAASRVPSTSKTTRRLPYRSRTPATCSSLFRGRASRSFRKRVRRDSTVAWSSAARKRL